MTAFEEGYAFFARQAGANMAAQISDGYVGIVNAEIEKLASDLNRFAGFQTAADKLKGDVAEYWHAGTFNVDAVARGSRGRTYVDRSHDFASADISSNFGAEFGLKYYKTGADSAKQQAKSLQERYESYRAAGGEEPIEVFLGKRGLDLETSLNDPVYGGQIRVIPQDQLESACDWLKKKIAKEAASRPEQVRRYQETLDKLSDRLKDGKGTESIPLSEADARILAAMAKEGAIDADTLKSLGLSADNAIHFAYLMQEAARSGLTAAAISIVLNVAPEIYQSIRYLIQTGEVDPEQFQKIGFAALKGGSEGFVRGSLSAAITIACKSGMMGEALKAVSPDIVGAAVVLAMNTLQNAFLVSTGQMTKAELAQALIKDMFITSSSVIFGSMGQAFCQIPVVGFLLGSFVGSVVGAFAYTCGYNVVIGFCINSGFTLFGLVDQDYTLPKSAIKEMGIEVFDHIHFEPRTIKVQNFTPIGFRPQTVQPRTLGLTVLRRGVIGVSQIGYV